MLAPPLAAAAAAAAINGTESKEGKRKTEIGKGEKKGGGLSHVSRSQRPSVAVHHLGAPVLDPLEPPPQRRLHPALHRVRLVPGDPLLPLHLRVREPPRLRRRRPAAVVARPAIPSRHRRRRGVVGRRRVRPVARAEPLPAHDLHPPVAAAAVRSVPVHEREAGASERVFRSSKPG